MKTLRKTITVGEYSFDVAVDRHIVAESFEKFPKLFEFLFKYSTNVNDADFFINAVKNKQLDVALNIESEIADFVAYAFPLMLKKADTESVPQTNNAKKCDEILKYIVDNEVDEQFNSAIFEMINSVFTQGITEKKPKVKFVME